MIEINSIVPNFSLIGSDKKEHSLSEYKGKKIGYTMVIGRKE